MKVTDVSYQKDSNGYPYISLKVDGKDARLHLVGGTKDVFLNMEYVLLAPSLFWEKELPPVTLPEDPKDNLSEIVLLGAVYSPELAAFYLQFKQAVHDGSFRVGPVEYFGMIS